MKKYIDADAVNRALDRIYNEAWLYDIPSPTVPEYIEHHDAIQQIMLVIDKERKLLSDAADVAPVRHGRWVPHVDYLEVKCSECGFFVKVDMVDQITKEKGLPNFCPHCGAKMDGGAIGDPMEDDLK